MNQPDPQRRIAGGVEYELTRRRVRNLNIRVRTDGSVAVSAPRRVPLSSVDAFVAAHAGWVAAAQGRMAVHMANRAAEPPLPSKAIALHQMQALCAQYYPLFAATCPRGEMPRIAVRDMSTRWGSCSLKTGTLCFALRLCVMPLPAQEYVVVHEFCHFAHPNHSPAFWAAVARVMPDYKARQALLKGRSVPFIIFHSPYLGCRELKSFVGQGASVLCSGKIPRTLLISTHSFILSRHYSFIYFKIQNLISRRRSALCQIPNATPRW